MQFVFCFSGSSEQLKIVLQQIGQQLPQQTITLMMHALRSVAKQGNLAMMQLLLEEIRSCDPHQVFELMKYALDGAAAQEIRLFYFIASGFQSSDLFIYDIPSQAGIHWESCICCRPGPGKMPWC